MQKVVLDKTMQEFILQCSDQLLDGASELTRCQFVRAFVLNPKMKDLLWAVGFRKSARLYQQNFGVERITATSVAEESDEVEDVEDVEESIQSI